MDTIVSPRMGNLRAYLAGTGATGALIAGAVVVFLAAGAFVAFNGFSLPGGSDGDASVAINSGSHLRGAPELAAATLAPGARAVAPAPRSVGSGTASGTAGSDGAGTASGGSSGSGLDGSGLAGSGGDPDTTTSSGPVTSAVGGVDDTTSGLGLPSAGSTTSGVTGQVDDTVKDTLNQVGGAVGDQNLGDQATGTVNDATGNLLGGGG